MDSLEKLLKIRAKVVGRWGEQFYNHIDFCGLVPVLHHESYDSTPKNSVTFAVTEGDGVHFGILTDTSFENVKPVVMTVPMVSKNLIIAEILDEFLGIGFHNGWDALEQLAYDFNETIKYYSTKDNSLTKQQELFLEFLRTELGIKHHPLTEKRLSDLSQRYVVVT